MNNIKTRILHRVYVSAFDCTVIYWTRVFRVNVGKGFSPEGTEANTADHVKQRVEDEQAQQQIEEYGLAGRERDGNIILQILHHSHGRQREEEIC